MALQISEVLLDLRAAEFSLEFEEDEARKAILELLDKDLPGSESLNSTELDAIEIATTRLKITSALTLLEEKSALNCQLRKVMRTNQREEELLKYLLYLLIKYRKFICRFQPGSHSMKHECRLQTSVNLVNSQVGDF